MPKLTKFKIARHDGEPAELSGHVIRLKRDGFVADVILCKTDLGYCAHHARTGHSIRPLDAETTMGKPITLREAKADAHAEAAKTNIVARIEQIARMLRTINDGFR